MTFENFNLENKGVSNRAAPLTTEDNDAQEQDRTRHKNTNAAQGRDKGRHGVQYGVTAL